MKFSDYCRNNTLNENNALNEANFGKQISHIEAAISELEHFSKLGDSAECIGTLAYILNCVALELKNSDSKDIQNVSKRLLSEVDVLSKYTK